MIVPLTPGDLPNVTLRFNSYFTRHTLSEYLHAQPTLGWRNSRCEYIVGGQWKGRTDVGELLESSGPAHTLVRGFGRGRTGNDPSWHDRRTELVERLMTAYGEAGTELVLLADREAELAAHSYLQLGWRPVEQIIYYRKPDTNLTVEPTDLRVEPLRQRDVPRLIQLERETFPWMWWYSADEWLSISFMPGVETFVATRNGELVGYETHTVRDDRGHLDRLGIHPGIQGQGYGTSLLSTAVRRMQRLGARSVGLSTQWNNTRSQMLYERHGFVRVGGSQTYYGRTLTPAAEARLAADGTCAPDAAASGREHG